MEGIKASLAECVVDGGTQGSGESVSVLWCGGERRDMAFWGCLMGPPWMCLSGGHPGGRASLGSGRQMDGRTERHLYGSVSQECIPSGTCKAVSFPSGF